MTRGRAIPAYQLALIRRLYETNPDLSINEIGRLAGVDGSTITRRARRESWRRATGARGVPADAATDDPGSSDPPGGDTRPGDVRSTDRRALIDGLWLAVTRHVAGLGGGAGDPAAGQAAGQAVGPSSGAASGPQSLMALARTFEKLVELEQGAAAQSAAAAPAPVPAEGPETIDDFRNEIARRLEGLLASRADR